MVTMDGSKIAINQMTVHHSMVARHRFAQSFMVVSAQPCFN
jgi:hypothetical protein